MTTATRPLLPSVESFQTDELTFSQKKRRWPLSWGALLERLVPIGYEDNHGFHYGKPVKAAEQDPG